MMKPVSMQNNKRDIIADLIFKLKNGKIFQMLLSKNNYILIPLAFLIGRVNIIGDMMPFGFAFFAAVSVIISRRWLLAAAIVLGMITRGTIDQIYITIAGMLLFSVLCLPFKNLKSNLMLKHSCIAFISITIPQIVMVSLQGFLLYDFLRAIFCSFIVFVMFFIFRNTLSLIPITAKKSILSNEEIISIAIAAALAVSGLGELQILGLSLKNVICITIILLFSFKCGPGVGAASGVAIGLIVSMSSKFMPIVIGTYAFCGLLSGIFKSFGKVGSGLGFILGNAIFTLYLSSASEAMIYLKEIIISVIAFFAIPHKFIDITIGPFVKDIGVYTDKRGHSRRIRDITVEKLEKFSKAFKELAITFSEISQTKVVTDKQDISVLFDRVADRICRDCSLCLHCWDRNFYNTYQVMFKIVEVLESKGRIEGYDVPDYFLDKCERINDFIDAINNIYELFKVEMVWKGKMGESRGLISQQFEGLSNVISGLAEEIDVQVNFIAELEDEIFNKLNNAGVRVKEVVAYKNKWGKYEASILHSGCGGARMCISHIEKIVSQAMRRRMTKESEECLKARDGSCTLKLVEEENFKIITSVAKLPKYQNTTSGDNFTFLNNGKGKYIVALSDGMGSGYRAAIQSKATVSLLENFMESGFDKDMTINLINSVLVLKSSDESFSTIDISVVDLFNGEVEFVKVGAVPTYIKKGEKVEMVKSASLPAGILGDIDTELIHKSVDSGDMIIMVTDGIIDSFEGEEACDKALMKFIQEIKSINPQQVADNILEKASNNCSGKPEDDMTVIVAKVWKKSR